MDTDILWKYIETAQKHYPDINITQLGMVVIWLGVIRSTLGHEHVKSTVENYIHKEGLSEDVAKCVEFLEREVLGIRKSKIDIDFWKFGNKGEFRPE